MPRETFRNGITWTSRIMGLSEPGFTGLSDSQIVDGLTFLGPVNAYSGNPMKTTHYCRSLYDPENLSILV